MIQPKIYDCQHKADGAIGRMAQGLINPDKKLCQQEYPQQSTQMYHHHHQEGVD